MICFDPRDKKQTLDAPSTWKDTDNPALEVAHYLAHDSGFSLVDGFWDKAAEAADFCDFKICVGDEIAQPDFNKLPNSAPTNS